MTRINDFLSSKHLNLTEFHTKTALVLNSVYHTNIPSKEFIQIIWNAEEMCKDLFVCLVENY